MSHIFRKEVIDAKRYQAIGDVIITQPRSYYLLAFALFVFISVSFTYISLFTYTRKVTVSGYLTPKDGVVKVASKKSGTIEEIYVKEGDYVRKGQVLFKVNNGQDMSDGDEFYKAVISEMTGEISSLYKEISNLENLNSLNLIRLDMAIDALDKEIISFKELEVLSKEKLVIKNNELKLNKNLLERKFISNEKYNTIKSDYISTLELYKKISIDINSKIQERRVLDLEKKLAPFQEQIKVSTIKREISSIQSKILEMKNNLEYIQKTPESGYVATIKIIEGSPVKQGEQLMSILPENSPLEIELLLPSKAAGFVKIKDRVHVRFDAFPYQKFGVKSGKVSKIDKTLILPSDGSLPYPINQPVYRVRSSLDEQFINAYGESYPLKIGMNVEADILLEERTLLEWMASPIHALRGKL